MRTTLGRRIESANAALFVEGGAQRIAEFFSPDYVVRLTRGRAKGHASIRRHLDMVQRAFPRVKVSVDILVEQGDRVAWRRKFGGVQRGPFHGFPATERRTQWQEMIISRFHGDLIAEEWLVSDLAEQLLLARKAS